LSHERLRLAHLRERLTRREPARARREVDHERDAHRGDRRMRDPRLCDPRRERGEARREREREPEWRGVEEVPGRALRANIGRKLAHALQSDTVGKKSRSAAVASCAARARQATAPSAHATATPRSPHATPTARAGGPVE
jgi:hypothetical protein